MATTGNNFSFTVANITNGEYSSNSYKNGTNCSYGFKVTKGTGKNIIIQFGLRNFSGAGSQTYQYGYTSSTTAPDNQVTVNGTKILLGDSHDGKYNYYVGNSWYNCSGMTWTVELTSGGSGGNTAVDIAYYMEMNNSCYPDGASGVLSIPAGVISSSNYYTACGAPTSVSISQSIVTPSGSITISWSGASGGTSNTISSYAIYYYITSGGTAPSTSTYTGSTTVNSTSTSGSTTITLSNATRGYTVVAGVVTRGSAGSSYYSGIKTGGSCKINTLPNAPTVSKTYQYFPSGGGKISATATAGATNDTGQTATLYYNSSNSHTGQSSMTSGGTFTSPTLSADTTYYFWTWDGLEYSSATTFTGYKNTTQPSPGAPTITSIISGTSSQTGKTGTLYSRLGSIKYNNIIRSSYATTTGGSCNLTVTIYYKGRGTSGSYNSKNILSSTNIGTATTKDVGGYNLVNNIGVDQEWYIQATLSDNLEQTTSRYPTSGVYYTPPKPTFNAFYNRQNSSDVSGFANYFYKEGRIYLSKETMFTSVTLNFSINTSPVSTLSPSATITTQTSDEYCNFSIAYSSTYGGKTLTLTSIQLSDGYNAININNPGITRTMIIEPALSGSIAGMVGTYKPYTNTSGTATVTAGLSTGLTTSNYASYGMTSNLSGIVLSMNYNNSSMNITSGSWSISNATLSRTINLSGLYSPSSNPLGFANIYSSYTYTLKITVTNAFGYTSSLSKNYTIDFRENPVIPNADYTIKATSQSGVSIANLAIQKGMTLYYSFKIQSYNQGKINYTLSYSLGTTTASKTQIKTGSVNFSTANPAMTIMTSAAQTGSFSCPNFTSGGNIYLHLDVTNANTSLSATRYITSKRNAIIDSSIGISAASSGDNVAVTVSYTSNIGLDLQSPSGVTYTRTYTTVVYADQNANPSTSVVTLSNQTSYPPTATQLTFTPATSVINIKVVTTQTITETYTSGSTTVTYSTTQTLTSNVYSFYGKIPTISYRDNVIIINNAYGTTSTDVVTITATETRGRIRLVGAGNNNNAAIYLGTASSKPYLYNFVIDCGSW